MAPRQKIVVTGANGFAARFLVKRLCDEGYDVHAADIRALPDDAVFGAIIDKRATFHLVDICDYDSVKLLLKGTYAVFHFAALVPYNLSRSYSKAELLRVNVDATQHLVSASQAAGVRYMIYASSTGVVFRGEDIANGDETWSTSPPLNDPYSESKSLAEHIVLSAHCSQPGEGMGTVAIRPNGIWGAGGEGHHIPKLLVAAQCGIAPFMAVTPFALTDFTHRANLVHACMCALARLEEGQGRRVVGGKAYFVTDGWPCHTLEFFSPLLQLLGYSSTPFPSAFYPRAWAGGRHGVKECARVGRPQWVEMEADWAREQGKKASVQPASPPPTTPSRASRSSGGGTRRGSHAAAGQMHAPLLPQASTPAAVPEEDEIVVTAEPFLPVPAPLLYLSASLLQLLALLLRPLVNVEPFLTLADARKVVQHNYYSSARARRELGYAPVITPAQGLRETAAYYAALGYDGRVTPAGWLPWLLAPGGIGVVGLLAGDAWGGGTAMYAAAERIGIPMNAAMRGLQWAVLRAVGGRTSSQCPPMGEEGAALWLLTLRWVFIAAVVTHLLEACWIGRQTWRWKKACAGWVWQTAWLGFPSMALAYEQAGHKAQGVVPLCLALFTAMAVLTPCLDVLTGCKAWAGHGAM